ncbi:RNA-directed DNA polymerase, eukaryota [Tanacetum coccineum]|uniref:RNA-directed DNA polymerase, eukaryota n=1 Tax=Tanacetum coccineum TaxID=301880 RepID=A0ABQ5BP66_9ASTR
MKNSNNSFVSVLKRGSQSHVTPEITKPALVLDDTCIKEFDFGMSLMGRAKDVSAIPNLPCIISKEGFQNVKLSYLGGMWVLFEFDSLTTKEKFLNHSGIGSWFTELIQATSSFENDERIVWISIEGLPIKAWTPNTFRKIASLWGEYVEWEDDDLKSLSCKHLCLKTNMKVIINERQKVIIQGKVYWIRVKELDAWFPNFQEDDQDDLSSDGESQEGDVANKADNNESDVDRVSESSFMHENDTAHKDANSCKKGEVGSHSEDPFNIYGILDGQKNNVLNNRKRLERFSLKKAESAYGSIEDQVQDLERPVTYEELISWFWQFFVGMALFLTAPFNYLGVNVGSNMSRINSWDDVISKKVTGMAGIYGSTSKKNGGLGPSIPWSFSTHSRFSRSPWQDVIIAIHSLQRRGLHLEVADLVLPNISDRWCWSLEGSQEFSVKILYILNDITILPKLKLPIDGLG